MFLFLIRLLLWAGINSLTRHTHIIKYLSYTCRLTVHVNVPFTRSSAASSGMDDAFHLAHSEYLTASHGSRSAALKVVIVVTDGEKCYYLMYIYIVSLARRTTISN